MCLLAQTFALSGLRDIRELIRRYPQLLGEYLPVAAGLVEHQDKVTVFKFVLSRGDVQKIIRDMKKAAQYTVPSGFFISDYHIQIQPKRKMNIIQFQKVEGIPVLKI